MTRFLLAATLALACRAATAAPPPDDLAPILAVGREGQGNPAAAARWKELVARGPAAIDTLLKGFDAASPTAANWLRSAVSAIADAETAAGRPLSAAPLKAFVEDTQRKPAARRIAFELYAAGDKARAAGLLATLVNDPDADLRRDAIAERLSRAEKTGPAELLATQKELVPLARDRDQIDALAAALDKSVGPDGAKFDKTAHLNTVTEWYVVGPFDNTADAGLARAYDPETAAFDPKADFQGKAGLVPWKFVQSGDEFGKVDLNKEIGKVKNAVTYTYAAVNAPAAMPAEVRVTSPNAVQIFVNGKKLHERAAYHNGTADDGHVAKATLNAGPNVILLKIAQNDMSQPWAQGWEFSGRVCDATGGRLPLQEILPSPDGTPRLVPLARRKPAPAPEKK